MTKLLMKMKNKKGFTLIELIVVIAILGILAAILIPQFTGFQDKARSSQALVEAKNWATAADAWLIENPGSNAAAIAAADAAIDTVAGTNGTVTNHGLTTDGQHVAFTYTTADGDYQSVRGADGTFTTSVLP